MERKKNYLFAALLLIFATVSCELVDDDLNKHWNPDSGNDSTAVDLDAVAEIIAALPLDDIHLKEVHAVSKRLR